MSVWILIKWLALQAPLVLASVGPPIPSGSGGGTSDGIQIDNPLGCSEWEVCIHGLLKGLAILAAPVAGVMILVGGFQLMFAGGNEEKIKGAKKTIVYTAIGYAVILLATGVAAIIRDALNVE